MALRTLPAVLAALLITPIACLAQEPHATLSAGRTFAEQGGAALYANVCAACHQADARGARGAAAYPALADNPNLAAAGYVETVVLQGLRGMPPVGRLMNDAQVAAVVTYVRSHFDNHYNDVVSAADVAALRGASRGAP